MNVPVGVAVTILTLRLLPASSGRAGAGRLDVAGAVTVTLALMLAVYAIVNGNDKGWLSGQTLGMLAGAVVLLAGFLAIESRGRRAADAAGDPATAEHLGRERRRDPLGGGDVRVVLPLKGFSAQQ